MRNATNAPGAQRARLFVAILLPDEWLRVLAATEDDLRRAGLRLRYARPEGIHLTLKFLGETSVDRLSDIKAALGAVAERGQPFGLQLSAAGTFGPRHRPRVVWVGVTGDTDRLATLQRAVDEALAPAGFARETRPFNAHLTLARVPEGWDGEQTARIGPAVDGLPRAAAAGLRVESIALMHSELGPGGARYTALAAWRFGAQTPA